MQIISGVQFYMIDHFLATCTQNFQIRVDGGQLQSPSLPRRCCHQSAPQWRHVPYRRCWGCSLSRFCGGNSSTVGSSGSGLAGVVAEHVTRVLRHAERTRHHELARSGGEAYQMWHDGSISWRACARCGAHHRCWRTPTCRI